MKITKEVQSKINEAIKKTNEALEIIEQAKREIQSIEFYLENQS